MIKVDMVSIPIKDQNRALKFYTEKLGFKVVTDASFGEGMRWIELSASDNNVRIALFTPPGHEDRIGTFSNVVFSCLDNDVKKTYEKLKKKGVEFTQSPKEESWGISALFLDTEGNTFCLAQPAEYP